ncbi:MAG: malate dehydrogenase [Rickettsia sp.]|nr:malate dehydrogenase [Rickettsia sp.]
MTKISLVGSGNIGASLAYIISLKNIATKLAIYDINGSITEGKSLDISQSNAIFRNDMNISSSTDVSIIKDSDVIVVTAGVPRKPGMSRDDLFETNLKIIRSIAENIHKYSPEALVIVVTNPVDAMVYAMYKYSKLPKNKVIGMAGVLDVSRYKYFLSQEFNVSIANIEAFILGGHGDFMVPLKRYTMIAGIPVLEMIKMGFSNSQKLDQIIERTKYGGGEIVTLLGNGSAYYAPAASIFEMIENYIFDKRKILSCSVLLEGEYGVHDAFVGVPMILGKNGVEKILTLDLTPGEQEEFDISVSKIKISIKSIN